MFSLNLKWLCPRHFFTSYSSRSHSPTHSIWISSAHLLSLTRFGSIPHSPNLLGVHRTRSMVAAAVQLWFRDNIALCLPFTIFLFFMSFSLCFRVCYDSCWTRRVDDKTESAKFSLVSFRPMNSQYMFMFIVAFWQCVSLWRLAILAICALRRTNLFARWRQSDVEKLTGIFYFCGTTATLCTIRWCHFSGQQSQKRRTKKKWFAWCSNFIMNYH